MHVPKIISPCIVSLIATREKKMIDHPGNDHPSTPEGVDKSECCFLSQNFGLTFLQPKSTTHLFRHSFNTNGSVGVGPLMSLLFASLYRLLLDANVISANVASRTSLWHSLCSSAKILQNVGSKSE